MDAGDEKKTERPLFNPDFPLIASEDEAEMAAFINGTLPAGADTARLNAALPALYSELREMAASYLRKERP
ncbi:MAG TPA: hypothetical protein VK474_04355, partial [Chthoniobacterales bacterium]|nr:hypothetical protein [Chthoniobacterales bacterium]